MPPVPARAAALAVALAIASACQPKAAAAPPDAAAVPCTASHREVKPGLVVDTTVDCLVAVRADPARFAPRLLTARAHGGPRTGRGWAHDFDLVAVINAAMYATDQRSIGLLVANGTTNNSRDNPKLGGFLAFDPVDEHDPPLVFTGRDCGDFDLAKLRAKYRSVVQDYRLLDCAGQPLPWKDAVPHVISAVGLDGRGWLTFVYARRPMPITDLARLLAGLGLVAALYVEGGPPAMLFLSDDGDGDHTLDETSLVPIPIPNVLGLTARPPQTVK